MKIYIRQSAILLLATVALLATGCGKSNDRFTAKRSGDVTSEGMMLCYQCHNDTDNPAGLEKVFGNSPSVVGWLNSPHANNETFSFVTYMRSDQSPDNIGMPYYGYEGLGQSPDCTTQCHDQLGDGRLIGPYAAKTGDTSLGRVDRPVIGCDSCHGSGNGHMAEATPGPSVCGQCHSSKFFHNSYHPEADNIVEYYQASPHAKSTNIYGMNVCSRCHTNEGAQAYIGLVNGTEAPADISYALDSQNSIENPTAVQCATCHDAHTLELLGERSNAGDGTWSAQFKTCTACHQLYDKTGVPHNAYHNGWTPDAVITDTHYDDPSDANIQGYIINATISHSPSAGNSNGGTCLDCHNEHNPDPTINRQWANSAHGGFILSTVDPVTGIGNVTTSVAPAWTVRDYKAPNRQDCQRCHTATGFRNLANDPATYDPANNVFTASGEQREMLYCWACHTNNVGGLRNPGIFNTTISPYSQPVDRIEAVGDLKGSNICVSCHIGRHSGDEIKNPLVPIDFTNSRAPSSHHLVAGGIMFNTIGYEYDGLDYTNVPWFKHRYIGLDNEPGGDNGPCVGCHMSAKAVGHTLDVVKKDNNDVITEVTAIEVCNNCHSRHPWTAETLEEKAEGFQDARTALDELIATKREACGSKDWTCPYPETGSNEPEKTMGAYFNDRLLGEDPGAFAHNSEYTKRLIFDSYDWMDNGIINGTIDLSSYPAAAAWFQGDDDTSNDNAVSRP